MIMGICEAELVVPRPGLIAKNWGTFPPLEPRHPMIALIGIRVAL